MFETGGCYAQFGKGYGEEFVFVHKVLDFSEESVSILGITIEQGGFTMEYSSHYGFEEEYYVPVPGGLFEEILALMQGRYDLDDSRLAMEYICRFREICHGNWRNVEEEI